MTIATMKVLLLLACVGHLALWRCDWIITYLDGGRFGFKDLQDNDRLSSVLGNTDPKKPMVSMVLGVFALTVAFPGYLAVGIWMKQFSPVLSVIMSISCILSVLPGIAHHVFCGAVEWFYIRLGKTEQARQAIVEFFKKTSCTMVFCYSFLLVFAVSLFVAVVAGMTTLPRWACVFNVLPLFIVLFPLRIVGTGNIANALMFLGLAVLI